MTIYGDRIREALTAAIDTTKLAEAWQALHPKDVSKAAALPPDQGQQDHGLSAGADVSPRGSRRRNLPARPVALPIQLPGSQVTQATKAISPVLGAFLNAARAAITRALQRILTRLWTEAWVLGQRAAGALTGPEPVDWGDWTPGDYEAAEAIAGPGLRQLLDNAGIQIKSITEDRLEELADVLEQTLASDVVHRQPLPAPLEPSLSVGDLARQLEDVLDNPSRAELVAQTEIARAQSEAARKVYAETGRTEVEISTAEDDKVCPVCDAAEKLGAHAIGAPPTVPLHPRCRCAELPVLEPA